jgi:hypothetical protein
MRPDDASVAMRDRLHSRKATDQQPGLRCDFSMPAFEALPSPKTIERRR